MRKSFFICLSSLFLFLLVSCNSVPGETSAGYSLRHDIIKGIGYWELSEGGICPPKIINTKKVADQVVPLELWTVDRNGTLVEYRIKLTPDGKGGTFIEVGKGASVKNFSDISLNLKYFQSSLPTAGWKLGYGGEDNQQGINEYVLIDETVQKWTKLITENYIFKFDDKSLSKYVSIIEDQLRSSSKDFKWTVIEKNESSILYEWSHNGSGAYPPTHEVAKLVTANGGLYRLSFDKYTEKENDDDIITWKEYIKNSKLKTNP